MGLLKDIKDTGFDVIELGLRAVRVGLYFLIAGLIWGAVGAFVVFIIAKILEFKTLFQDFLDKISSLASGGGDGSCISQSISYALSCSGILDGLNNAYPILLTSVTFLFLVLISGYSFDMIKIVSDTIYKLFNISRK